MSVPAEFADLEPYLEQWALPTETARNSARLSSEMEDITAFYTVMQVVNPAAAGPLTRKEQYRFQP